MNRRSFVGTLLGAAVAAPVAGLVPGNLDVTIAPPRKRLDLATARTALLSGDQIVCVSTLVLIAGMVGGLRTNFRLEKVGEGDATITVDGMCLLDREGHRHGHIVLDHTTIDVAEEPTEVLVDLHMQLELGAPRSTETAMPEVGGRADHAVSMLGQADASNTRVQNVLADYQKARDPAPLTHKGEDRDATLRKARLIRPQ